MRLELLLRYALLMIASFLLYQQEGKLEEDVGSLIKSIFQGSKEVIRKINDDELDDDNDRILPGLNSGETSNVGSKKRKDKQQFTGLRLKIYSSEDGESMLRICVDLSREAKDIYYKRCPGSFYNSPDDGIILNHHSILMVASVTSYAADLPMVLNTCGLT
ncbi:hypothetical protein Tco_0352800 [Tanacetum coccineum]